PPARRGRPGRRRRRGEAARGARRRRPRLGAGPRDVGGPDPAVGGRARRAARRRGRGRGAVLPARRAARAGPGPGGERHGVVRNALAPARRLVRARSAPRRHQDGRAAARAPAVRPARPDPSAGRHAAGHGGGVRPGRGDPARRGRPRPRLAVRRPLRAALVRRVRVGAAGAAPLDARRRDPARPHRRAELRLPPGPRPRPDQPARRPVVAVHLRSADLGSVDAGGASADPGPAVSSFLRSSSSDRTPAASISGVARLSDTDRITTPESFTSIPMTPTMSAQISAGRIVALCSYARCRTDTLHRVGRARTKKRNTTAAATASVYGQYPRLFTMASNLRVTMPHARPSTRSCPNPPRCGGAALLEFRKEMNSTSAAPARPVGTRRSGETRRPATISASIANAGTIAMTPPKSLPHAGSPSTATANAPITATIPAASALRPARSGYSASQIGRAHV